MNIKTFSLLTNGLTDNVQLELVLEEGGITSLWHKDKSLALSFTTQHALPRKI